MSATASLALSFDAGVYELALAKTPCNEIGTALLAELEAAVAQLDPQQGRALLIHSTVPAGFSAGADLRELLAAVDGDDPQRRLPELAAFLDRVHGVMNALDALPMVTVAAIHGVCFGGGLELALTCDLRVADRSARFCFPELRLGLIPGFGGIPRLRRELPGPVVRDLLLTGRSLNAQRAADLGLVSQLVGRGAALEVARRAARRAAELDREASLTAKRFAKPVPDPRLAAELEVEKEHFLRLFTRPAVLAGLRRFADSRDPRPYL